MNREIAWLVSGELMKAGITVKIEQTDNKDVKGGYMVSAIQSTFYREDIKVFEDISQKVKVDYYIECSEHYAYFYDRED